jgi:hypothetical protein
MNGPQSQSGHGGKEKNPALGSFILSDNCFVDGHIKCGLLGQQTTYSAPYIFHLQYLPLLYST